MEATTTLDTGPADVPAGLVHAGVRPVAPDPTVGELSDVLERLARVGGAGASDADRVDQLGLLEQVKGAAAAAQARVSVEFERSQLAVQDARGVRARERGRGIGDQVALARGTAASQGARHLGFAKAIVGEMAHTHALLAAGRISEWVATLLVKETACLSVEDRRRVDEHLCAMTVNTATGELHPPRVLGMTPRRVESAARALAQQLDPAAAVARAAKAAKDRRVSCRPVPDTMTRVSGLVPVAQGVACWANLDKAARALKAGGDERSLDQIRADLFVERLTGQASADAVPVAIGLVMAPDTLTGEGADADRPARTDDGTPIPAQTARDLLTTAEEAGAEHSIRTVSVHPDTGQVTGVGKPWKKQQKPQKKRKPRFHRGETARVIRARDQHCRHPGCDGGIGHLDHPIPAAEGGETSLANGQGLCEGHNYVKQIPGWSVRVIDDRPGHHTIEITTPTGHTYRSHTPPGLPLRL